MATPYAVPVTAPRGRFAGVSAEGVEVHRVAVDAARIDESLVRALLAEQLPELAALPVRRVEPGGNDHRTFRLGEELLVRLPSAPGYVPQVVKEQTWLPRLAPLLPLPVPAVHAVGVPSPLFAAPWSVYGWLEGTPASVAHVDDQERQLQRDGE